MQAHIQDTAGRSYQAPTTLDELLATVASAGEAAMLIAGGQSLLPKLARLTPTRCCLIDVGRVAELRRISITHDYIEIGAAATFSEVLQSDARTLLPALVRALRYVGTSTIRNRATVGGSLAWADPRAELPLALLIHDAVVLTSRREMTIDQFIRGPFRCALEPGEVILGVRIAHGDGVRRGFGQLLDRNSAGKAIVSVSMAVRSQAHETNLRVAVGAVADRPIVSATIRADSQASSAGYERATRHWLERVCREHSLLEDPFHSINYRCEMAVVIAGRIGRELHS